MAIEKRPDEQDGWNEYSKLVISELERLNENDEKTLLILSEINMKFSRFEAVEKEMESVLKWKRYMEDVASPNTLKDLKSDVIKLNTFKTVATTVWAVVQIAFAIFVALNK
tara:strand:- start:1901 stop:2233 length:333 start_codon:yes stop_codon:yes gene_type:complete